MHFHFAAVLVFLLFSVAFVALTYGISRLLRPDNPYAAKLNTYECGEIPFGGSWIQFNLRYYLIALIFLIFEVEVVFLYPWAVVLKKIGAFAFWEMLVFLGILFAGFAYVWRKNDFTWFASPDSAQTDGKPPVA